MTKKLSLILLPLLSLACSGAEFSALAPADTAGAAGETVATGGTAGDPGAGGTAGGTAGKGGSGGTATGGSLSTGGSGGTAGAGSVGPAGSGGTAATGVCTPDKAITVAKTPTTFTWHGFESTGGDGEREWCAYSTGGTCTLTIYQITIREDGALGALSADVSCDANVLGGECGIETACGDLSVGRLNVYFDITKSGGGFVTAPADRLALDVRAGSCELGAANELSAEVSLWTDAAAIFDGKLWTCS